MLLWLFQYAAFLFFSITENYKKWLFLVKNGYFAPPFDGN